MIEIISASIQIPPLDAFTEFFDAPHARILVTNDGKKTIFLVHPKSPTIPLGNHYHTGLVAEKNPELINLVNGSWKIVAQHVDRAGHLTGSPVEYRARAGQTVIIPAMVWHALYAETPDAALVEFYNNKDDYMRDVNRLL